MVMAGLGGGIAKADETRPVSMKSERDKMASC